MSVLGGSGPLSSCGRWFRGVGIPEALRLGLQFLQQGEVMVPGDLCKRRLHNCLVGPGFGESPHVFEVTWRKAGHVGEGAAEVGGEAVDHLGSPSLVLLAVEDVSADVPIEKHHLAVYRQD